MQTENTTHLNNDDALFASFQERRIALQKRIDDAKEVEAKCLATRHGEFPPCDIDSVRDFIRAREKEIQALRVEWLNARAFTVTGKHEDGSPRYQHEENED
jgi:hypothetical protein